MSRFVYACYFLSTRTLQKNKIIKKALLYAMLLLFVPSRLQASDYGNVSDGTTIDTLITNDTVGTMTGGTINTMTGGTVNTIGEEIDRDNARIKQMDGGTILKINHGYLDNMTNGTIETINNGTFGTITGGHINFISNGNFVEIGGNTTIDTIANGQYQLLSGGVVSQIRHGHFLNISGGEINQISYAWVDLLSGGTVHSMENGEITRLSGGLVESMSGGIVTDMDGGKIENISGGTIANALAGAQIDKISNRGSIGHLNGANVTEMVGGTVEIMDGGTIAGMSGGIVDMINNGTVTQASGGTVNALNGGTISTLSGANVVSMYQGTISSMTGGSVSDMYGGTLENMTGGRVEDLLGATVAKLDGGSVVSFHSGTVQDMQSGSIADMYDGTVQTMNGGTIKKMSGGEVQSMNDGTIDLMSGGKIKDMAANAVITKVDDGTIYGNVQSGAKITVGSQGNLYLDGAGNTFDTEVTANGAIHAIAYNFGPNSNFNLNNDGILFIAADNLSFNKVTVNDGGIIAFEANKPFYNAVIDNLVANGTGNMIFNINETDGSANILTVNNSAGGNFFVHVASHAQDDSESVEKINLLKDNSSSLSLSLPGGSYVGVGASNYKLLNESGLWSLMLARDTGLSDQAKIVGGAAADKLIQAYAIQNALHRRLGDLRLANKGTGPGLWIRTYTNQSQFKDLTTIRGYGYGTELGVDFEVSKNKTGRLILGGSFGYNHSDADYQTVYSRDGRSEINVPYGALYGTYLFNNNVYIDLIARYAYNDMKVYYYDGSFHRQRFDTDSGIGIFSGEIGYVHYLSRKFSIEPRTELSYAYIAEDKFIDSLGYAGSYKSEQSVLGTVGIVAKYDFENISPYLKLSYINEFSGTTKIRYDNTEYKSDLSGDRFEVGTGFTSQVDDNFGAYLELSYQSGDQSYRNYIGNIGLRYNF